MIARITVTKRRALVIASNACALRHFRSRTDFVIRNGFELVGATKKRSKVCIDTEVVPRVPGKLAVHALVRLEDTVFALEDQSLRRMISREICGTAGGVGIADAKDRFGLFQKLPRLLEKSFRLGLHKSRPSRRISCINGMRGSSYVPAAYGMAWTSAPVS